MSTPNRESEPRLAVVSLQSRIGAEIRNVTLSEDIDDATIATIREALLKYKVIFFRDQHQMDDRVQEAFAEQLGEPIKHPNAETAGNSEFLLDLDAAAGYAASAWHTDLTCLPAYPAASILRAIDVPKDCGDTMWANTAAAYGDMPPPLQLFADHLRAIHTSAVDFDTIFDDRVRERVGNKGEGAAKLFETEHPVVRVHPETGESAVNRHFCQAAGRLRQRAVPTHPVAAAGLRDTAREHNSLALAAW